MTSASKLTAISPNFFRNWASDRQEGKILADQIIEKGYKNVAILYEETDYAKGLKMDVESNLKDAGVKITSESFGSGATDVRTQLTKLKSIKSDVLLVSVQTVTSGEVVLTQMEQLKFSPTMLVNYNILKATALVKSHAALLEGARGGDYALQDSEKLNKVLAEYKAKYGVDCPQKNVCAMEYDTIQMLAQALRAKGDSAQGVREYLSSNTYSGASGSLSFDANNDRMGTDYLLFGIKNGETYRVME
jgi:branched-chain amino acid transport system substrate-binding protein